jgi:HAD superfamily hydrolase (TIGR01484 family)
MVPVSHLPELTKRNIGFVLTDIDDTLTNNGRLTAEAYSAMQRLHANGKKVIPITGRPAGWCDHITRMWPVDALVGENGAFYFYYDHFHKKMVRRYWKTPEERAQDKVRLKAVEAEILAQVPGARVAADQAYREADLAIDFCEDVPRLPNDQIMQILHCFEKAGARAKISSIHVNGWYGDYDKLAMTRLLFQEKYETHLNRVKDRILFIGDSPNDEPMFAFFKNSVGVANVKAFVKEIDNLPSWITLKKGGLGFAEMVDTLLEASP